MPRWSNFLLIISVPGSLGTDFMHKLFSVVMCERDSNTDKTYQTSPFPVTELFGCAPAGRGRTAISGLKSYALCFTLNNFVCRIMVTDYYSIAF